MTVNTSHLKNTIVVLVGLLFLCTNIAAQQSFAPGSPLLQSESPTSTIHNRNYYAVIIGIADYPGTSNDLDYCVDDAIAVNNLLVENFYFPWKNIQLLLNQNATKLSIKNAFNSIKGNVTSQDVIFFFFSGHGHQDGISEYLTPFDGLMNPKIADSELEGWINDLSFYRFVMVLDACYSGGIVENITNPNVIAMSACGKDELSYESDTLFHGVFSYYFLDAFARNTSQHYIYDGNNDGCIALLAEAFDHANSYSRSYYLGSGITINPQAKNNGDQDMVLEWQMGIEGIVYSGSTRSVLLMIETNRTSTFNLSISCAPCDYMHQSANSWSFHEVIIEPLAFPSVVPLAWLDTGMTYALMINQSIQNQSVAFVYRPFQADFDGDGIADGVEWELGWLYDPSDPSDGILDHDGDGLDIYAEYYRYHTNPLSSDTDSDLFDDGVEIQLGTDPRNQIDSPLSRFLLVAAIVGCLVIIILIRYRRQKQLHLGKNGKLLVHKRIFRFKSRQF